MAHHASATMMVNGIGLFDAAPAHHVLHTDAQLTALALGNPFGPVRGSAPASRPCRTLFRWPPNPSREGIGSKGKGEGQEVGPL
jgi:hypothetical protein